MTALQTTPALPAGRYGFAHAARMEWIKLRSLRSTLWALVATVAGMLVTGIVTMANTHAPSPDKADTFDPVNNVLAGIALGQLIVGVLGVLVVTGEYSSGAIRSTLAAIPDRSLLLAAKAGVFGAVTSVLGEVVAFATFFAGRAALSDGVPVPGPGDPGVLRAVVLSGAYLAMVGLLGIALGAVLRHTAAAVGALVGLLYVLPAVLSGLTGVTVAKYFPTMIAGNSLAVSKPVADVLSPWAGFGVLCVYVLAALGAGGWLLTRRDA
ncbi:ABC transporter permease [Streptomyces sp. NPDC001940]|uniref:ABC transporter permease n=1 Tax=Streptomyces sp. NBC_00401 TaxID=2975738 RepID=UPI0022527423|nr:ABC transporter permease [Streptomyces sp. NBC_00401]MCX5079457.1 ABC transporter permease [Streptomyces sp. NBC_00401]